MRDVLATPSMVPGWFTTKWTSEAQMARPGFNIPAGSKTAFA